MAICRLIQRAGPIGPKFKLPGMRDTDNAAEFLREVDEYKRNFDSPNPARPLPNFM